MIVPVCCSNLEYTIINVIGPALAFSGCEERLAVDLQTQTRVENSRRGLEGRDSSGCLRYIDARPDS